MLCFVLATEVVVGVPALYLEYTKNLLPPNVAVSAQNCYKVPKGAFTGMYQSSALVVYARVKVRLNSVNRVGYFWGSFRTFLEIVNVYYKTRKMSV
jgi:hypothetical protein